MAPRIPKQNARFINLEGETQRGRSALEAMRGYAGAPSRASVMYPGSAAAYEGGELTGMAEMLIPGASLAKGALGAVLAGVIKPRGGSWLTGSVEGALGGLRKYSDDNEMEMFRGLASNREKELMDLNQQRAATLDKLRAEGQPDSVINLVDAEFTGKIDQANQLLSGNLGELAKLDRNASLNRWIEGPLTKYIKRDMATPEDPVRKLAEEGILHYDPIANDDIRSGADYVRQLARGRGFPGVKLGKSDLAQRWENLTDIHLEPNYVGKGDPLPFPTKQNKSFSQDMEWLERVRNAPEESQLFGSYLDPGMAREVGFPHLVDELSNSLNPDSGLPRNLLLRPEQMQQMGIEKAVRHVDAINKWRAAQQAAANAELANKATVIREYSENNPKGLRWVELKANEVNPPEGYEYDNRTGRYIDPWDEASQPWTPKQDRKAAEEELARQLKYEGDTMGHCVGGYCPDVLEGRSRIFSLRDAKGEPHVTIEVSPNSDDNELMRIAEDRAYYRLGGSDHPDFEDVKEDIFRQLAQRENRIRQIKGKQNLAPKDEYLPFVQDFVRNNPLGGSWADVDDLINTGLRRVGDKYVTPEELKNMPKTPDGFPIGYQPLDDRPAWKDGGLVAQPDYFDDLEAFLGR